jgi:hypothetical protein
MPLQSLEAVHIDDYWKGDLNTHHYYWTRPGEYTLRASCEVAVSPAPKDTKPYGDRLNGFGRVTLTSNAVTLNVVDGKEQPAAYPLQLKLVAKKDTYTLDLGGKTAEQFRKDIEKTVQDARDNKLPAEQMRDVRRLLPQTPAVDLALEVTNSGKEEQTLEIQPYFDLDPHGTVRGPLALQGPLTTVIPPPPKDAPIARAADTASFQSRGDGAFTVSIGTFMRLALDVRPIRVTLKPGETKAVAIPISNLTHGSTYRPNRGSFAYWTQPGDYTLTAKLSAAVKPAPQGARPYWDNKDYGMLSLVSNAVRLKVVEPKGEGKAELPGAPLELKLVANKDTYMLDLGGKTPEEFRKYVEDNRAGVGGFQMAPAKAPAVDLVAELRNVSDEDVDVRIGGIPARFTLGLDGPGAFRISGKYGELGPRPEQIAKENVRLKAGQTHRFPIQSLFIRNAAAHDELSFWTKPGDYTLRITFETAVAPSPKGAATEGGGFGRVTLNSEPIKLKVMEKK